MALTLIVERLQAAPAVPPVSLQLSEPERPALPSLDGSFGPSERVSPAVQKAVDWLRANPESNSLSIREVASRSGLSKTAIERAKRSLSQTVPK